MDVVGRLDVGLDPVDATGSRPRNRTNYAATRTNRRRMLIFWAVCFALGGLVLQNYWLLPAGLLTNVVGDYGLIYSGIKQPPENLSSLSTYGDAPSDWFDKETWESETSAKGSCLYIEDVCHASQHWFYKPINTSHQPYPFSLKIHRGWGPDTATKGYPNPVEVLSESPYPNLACRYSRIPNHFTLYSDYNDMLGEFYDRLFVGFWQAVTEYNTAVKKKRQRHRYWQANGTAPINNTNRGDYQKDVPVFTDEEVMDEERDPAPFATQSQVYLHLFQGSTILDSHKLFFALLSDLPVLLLTNLLDTPNCICLKRLFFCGYDNDPPEDPEVATTVVGLRPAGVVTRTQYDGLYQDLRQDLLNKFVRDNSMLGDHIQQRRNQSIPDVGSADVSSATGAVSSAQRHEEWKIIGLSQRIKRRRWEGLEDIIKQCNEEFNSKMIVCIEVNIEKEIDPVGHAVAHAGLDVLMGIHGAQLTEGLLMPKGSLVVEFLPWIPYNWTRWGSWTAMCDSPTPLGIIFKDTDLNHIGYPLQRSSVDDCHRENFTKTCMEQGHLAWDNRNFVLEWDVVRDIVNRFVIAKSKTCREFQDQEGGDYVLYNVNCIPDDGNETRASHFYRPEGWVEEKTLWTIEMELNQQSTQSTDTIS